MIDHLESDIAMTTRSRSMDAYRLIVKEHDEKRAEFKALEREIQAAALKGVRLVGCMTNGAARLKEVLQTLNPRVLIVEEAGQVLESHILAALSPSIQHLIQIGDPEQLRCIANIHELSVDIHAATKWRYNESMMERLSRDGLRMDQLLSQRRMRPQISALIRWVRVDVAD